MIASEIIREDPNSKWEGMPQDSPSRHTPLHMRKRALIILLQSCSPPELKILYETLTEKKN